MTADDWATLVLVATPVLLAVTPWMFMVHAKLAVIANKVSDLCETIQRANEQLLQLARVIHRHENRLDELENHVVAIARDAHDTGQQ